MGTCPTIDPSLKTATALLSLTLEGSGLASKICKKITNTEIIV